jgi:hypothetical protein
MKEADIRDNIPVAIFDHIYIGCLIAAIKAFRYGLHYLL